MPDPFEKCAVCHALVDEEDLFCANCGTEAPRRADHKPDLARSTTDNFQCQSCGASMSYDASAKSLACPFCGSVELAKQADAKTLTPSRVLPFALPRAQAEATLRTWLSKGFWRPGDLSENASIVAMRPVYVPYWVFSAKTHTYWTADTNHTPPGARASWAPIGGEHRGAYEGLLVGASGALTPAETAQLLPFDLSQGLAPEHVDLVNMTVEQFAVGRKYARPMARQGLDEMERAACTRYVPGASRNVRVNTKVEGLTSEPVLIPVWIMAYRYKTKIFRFLANGQTGKSTGTAPISYRKIAGCVVAIAAVVAVGLGIAALSALFGR